jgi:hypothetical protein
VSARKRKSALTTPISKNEKPEAVESTPSPRTRKHGHADACLCTDCLLDEMGREAARLPDAIAAARGRRTEHIGDGTLPDVCNSLRQLYDLIGEHPKVILRDAAARLTAILRGPKRGKSVLE